MRDTNLHKPLSATEGMSSRAQSVQEKDKEQSWGWRLFVGSQVGR